jgi:hypothetical protein
MAEHTRGVSEAREFELHRPHRIGENEVGDGLLGIAKVLVPSPDEFQQRGV